MKLYNRNHLAVAALASTGPHRYALSAVRFEADGSTVGSDGRVLLKAGPSDTSRAEDLDQLHGAWPGDLAIGDATEHEPFLLDARVVTWLGRALAARGPTEARHVALREHSAGLDGRVEMLTPSGKHLLATREGYYPPYETVIPKGEPAVSVHFSAELLLELLTAVCGCLDEDGSKTVRLDVYGDGQPVVLHARVRSAEQDLLGAIVPSEPYHDHDH